MARISGAVLLAGLTLAATQARADCWADFDRVTQAQVARASSEEGGEPTRTVTVTTHAGGATTTTTTEHVPPDRTRSVISRPDGDEGTLVIGDRVWMVHGTALQEVATATARDMVTRMHARMKDWHDHLVQVDWHKRAQNLACKPDATYEGKPAEAFTFEDAELKQRDTVLVDPATLLPLRHEAEGSGVKMVQTITIDPALKLEAPPGP